MISETSDKWAVNALFSRVCGASHPAWDVVLFHIICCFFTYYDEKMGYKMGYRAKGCGVQILIIWIVFIIIHHPLTKYIIRLLISKYSIKLLQLFLLEFFSNMHIKIHCHL